MKKKYLQALSLFLTVSMLTGCGGSTRTLAPANNENSQMEETTELQGEEKGTTESQEEGNETSSLDYSNYVEGLRAKYGTNQSDVEYTDPMYNLPLDHTFVFENVCEEAYEGGLSYDSIRVFIDPELTKEVYTEVEEDYDNGTLKLKPWSVFSLEGESNGIDNGTWGSRSKFYLAQYKDLTTNETYEKPHVTVFTIARELDTPTLEQSLSDMGEYQLTWNSIKGADYYEVYEYDAEGDYAYLICETKETNCKEELYSLHNHESFDEEGEITSQNMSLLIHDAFLVVAKTEDGKISGMSNICNVQDIAYTIPTYVHSSMSDEEYEEERFCEGKSALVLPTHMSVRMLDESVTKELLDYENAEIEDVGDLIEVRPKFVNLKMDADSIYISGMSEEELRADMKKVIERQKELENKTARKTVDIDIPYAPTSDNGDTQEGDENKTGEDEKKSDDEKKSGEDEKKSDDDDEKKSDDDDEKKSDDDDEKKSDDDDEKKSDDDDDEKKSDDDDDEKKSDDDDDEKKSDDDDDEKKSDDDDEKKSDDDDEKTTASATNIEDTVYANSALSAHIAINMLENEKEIPLDDFPESSDRDFLMECILEAYNQNPLIGIMEDVGYDYDSNCLVVSYVLDKDESISKRDAALAKAQEITAEIITDDMSDFEKEEAINDYLCANGSYDESIFEYIQEDGSISDDVLDETVDSFLPYGILVNNVGVCESYSEAFLLLARNAGLDAVIETGRMDGIAHEWNRVKIDGEWYVMDVTNNDNEKVPNAYFNLSDSFSKEFLIPDKNAISLDAYGEYAATSDDKEFYLIKGKCAEDKEDAVELMGNLLDDNNMETIRVNEELDESDVEEIVRSVAQNNGITDGSYFYYRGLLSMIKE